MNHEHEFDKDFWESHWQDRPDGTPVSMAVQPPHPALVRETGDLPPGTALEAGCGAGTEAIWLASADWHVTGVDISTVALQRATEQAATRGVAGRIHWIVADLVTWNPDSQFDLVTSLYAHPSMPQLDFYTRISRWVKPGGTLFLVGHLHAPDPAGHDHHPPAEVSVTAAAIAERLGTADWRIETASEHDRVITNQGSHEITLHDVIVRATRLR